ncbi:MAG: hypothetical protein N3G20_08780, partial [Verrucomicrobiae bacterium]|nr:hypothetical protein [Verrucomicrobiae bacterium]
ILRYPRVFPAGHRVAMPVSTRRIFHTVLDVVGINQPKSPDDRGVPVDVVGLSLVRALDPTSDAEGGVVYTEAPVPETLIGLMEAVNQCDLIDAFRCRAKREAIYRGNYKLIAVDGRPDELFDLAQDRGETHNLLDREPVLAAELEQLLNAKRSEAELRRPANWQAARLCLEEDQKLVERLRGLGYLG